MPDLTRRLFRETLAKPSRLLDWLVRDNLEGLSFFAAGRDLHPFLDENNGLHPVLVEEAYIPRTPRQRAAAHPTTPA